MSRFTLLLALVLAAAVVATIGIRFFAPWILPRYLYFPQRLDADEADPARRGLAGVEAVRLVAADGVVLHGWWMPTTSDDRCGTAIYLHGNAGSIVGREGIAREIARTGLDVLLFDYRGYGASAGSPSEAGLYRDADAAWRHVRETRRVAPDRILLFGESLGGAVALELATRRPVGAIALAAPLPGTIPVARALYPWMPDAVLTWNAERFDAMERVGRVRAPVFVAHGTADRIIDPRLGRGLYDAAPGPRRWYAAKGFGHNDLYEDPGFWRAFAEFVSDALTCRS